MDFLFVPALAEEAEKTNYVTDTLFKKLLNAFSLLDALILYSCL